MIRISPLLSLVASLALAGPAVAQESEAVMRVPLSSPILLSGSTSPAVTETGRAPGEQSRTCTVGYEGEETRTGTIVSWSDGTTTELGDWSAWDVSQCEVDMRVEAETRACQQPLHSGNETRQQVYGLYADGSERPKGEPTPWNTSACIPLPPAEAEFENYLTLNDLIKARAGMSVALLLSDIDAAGQMPPGWTYTGNGVSDGKGGTLTLVTVTPGSIPLPPVVGLRNTSVLKAACIKLVQYDTQHNGVDGLMLYGANVNGNWINDQGGVHPLNNVTSVSLATATAACSLTTNNVYVYMAR